MITKEELIQYAKIRKLNLGQAEKDYFQIIVLFVLYQSYGKELIFKGGTALNKCYGLDRFSEDLDFSSKEKIDLQRLESELKRFRLEYEIESKPFNNSISFVLRIKGPLYIKAKNSICKVIIDDSVRENVILKPELKTIGRLLDEIPSFEVVVMQPREIFAEKIRAIMLRDKARDIYDLYYLLRNGIEIDVELIKEKLKYYDGTWNFEDFMKQLNNKESVWISELKPLVQIVPNFEQIKQEIIDRLKQYQ